MVRSIQSKVDTILITAILASSAGLLIGSEFLMINERSRRHEFLAMRTGSELVKNWRSTNNTVTPEAVTDILNRLSNVRTTVWIVDGKGEVIMADQSPSRELRSPDLLRLSNYKSAVSRKPDYFRKDGVTYFTCAMPLPENLRISGNSNNWAVRFIEDTARTPLSSPTHSLALFAVISGSAAIFGLFLRRAIAHALKPMSLMERALDDLSLQDKADESVRLLEISSYPAELKNIASKFNTMSKRIDEQSKDVNFFISAISHELRNQLTLIKGYSSRLYKYLQREEPKQRLESATLNIESAVDDSINTLSNLVQLARAGSGHLALNINPLSIQSLLEEVRSRASSNVLLKVKQVACDDVYIQADAQVLRSAIMSLIENAEKYASDAGEIEIYGHTDSAGKYFFIDVRDFGDGVPEESANSIFERFKRGSNSSLTYGTGLGLAVVRETLVLMNSGIELISNPYGKGACFRITVPVCQSESDRRQ